MPPPVTMCDFTALVRQSGLISPELLERLLATPAVKKLARARGDAEAGARALIDAQLLTGFQARQLLRGRYKGFTLGHYVVEERLGFGGMGLVYRARHLAMEHRVAIKLLSPQAAADPATLARFYREARAAAAVNHPNVVRATDVGEDGGRHYLVLEYVEGEDLQAMVRRRGPLPVPEALGYVAQALRGLQHLIEQGLIHRDLKPANLLVDRGGTVKILDMGLARFTNHRQDNLTRQVDTGAILGTADYMSPEQTLDMHAVDVRSDVYTLGATLYFLLAGRAPFEGLETSQKLLAIQLSEPRPLAALRPDVPAGAVRFVKTMMAKQPEDRYQTPAEALEDLAPWLPVSWSAPASPGPAPSQAPRSVNGRARGAAGAKKTNAARDGFRSRWAALPRAYRRAGVAAAVAVPALFVAAALFGAGRGGGEPFELPLKSFRFAQQFGGTEALQGYDGNEKRVYFYFNGPAEATVGVQDDGVYEVVVKASCDPALDGFAHFTLSIDGVAVGNETRLTAAEPRDYKFSARLKNGARRLVLEYTNDVYQEGEYDRNLYVHKVTLRRVR